MCEDFYGHMFSTHFSKHQRVWLLDHMVRLGPASWPVKYQFAFLLAMNESYHCCWSWPSFSVIIFSSVQFSCSVVSDSATPCTIALQASLLSFYNKYFTRFTLISWKKSWMKYLRMHITYNKERKCSFT